jgi:intracellular sulfur oxidation DsrE/DsrF family protein
MRSTYALACLFAAMFVMATSSHAETSGGGDGGLLASEVAQTPVSRRATASRTRKVVSARPKLREKTRLTRVAVERKVIRAAQNPVSRRATASRMRKVASARPKLREKTNLTRVAVERKVIRAAQKPANPRVATARSSAPKLDKTSGVEATEHRLVIQVTQNDPALMNMALNNAQNVVKHYGDKGEKVQVEFVAYGPGLHMVRSDTSPVKERLSVFALQNPTVMFSGCGNTMSAQGKQENKEISLVPEARVVPTGIARILELQEQGWSYVRP